MNILTYICTIVADLEIMKAGGGRKQARMGVGIWKKIVWLQLLRLNQNFRWHARRDLKDFTISVGRWLPPQNPFLYTGGAKKQPL